MLVLCHESIEEEMMILLMLLLSLEDCCCCCCSKSRVSGGAANLFSSSIVLLLRLRQSSLLHKISQSQSRPTTNQNSGDAPKFSRPTFLPAACLAAGSIFLAAYF
jgi:hypothetical protein